MQIHMYDSSVKECTQVCAHNRECAEDSTARLECTAAQANGKASGSGGATTSRLTQSINTATTQEMLDRINVVLDSVIEGRLNTTSETHNETTNETNTEIETNNETNS